MIASWSFFKGQFKYLRKAIKDLGGGAPGECPLCHYKGRFINAGTPAVIGAKCPSCGSTPRHRLFKLVVEKDGLISPNADILHFAAERSLLNLIRACRPNRYVTADIRPGFDLQLDIENLDVPDESYDAIICSHVLEHVDDQLALRNLYRALRPGGRLIAMVPIVEGWDSTYENSEITSWRARKLHFGGGTHVRYYGRDFRDRLAAAKFTVSEFTSEPQQVLKYRLIRGERVFVGTKPVASAYRSRNLHAADEVVNSVS